MWGLFYFARYGHLTLLYEELWVEGDRALREKRVRIHGRRLVRKENRLHYVLEAHMVNILLFACVLFWLFSNGTVFCLLFCAALASLRFLCFSFHGVSRLFVLSSLEEEIKRWILTSVWFVAFFKNECSYIWRKNSLQLDLDPTYFILHRQYIHRNVGNLVGLLHGCSCSSVCAAILSFFTL